MGANLKNKQVLFDAVLTFHLELHAIFLSQILVGGREEQEYYADPQCDSKNKFENQLSFRGITKDHMYINGHVKMDASQKAKNA